MRQLRISRTADCRKQTYGHEDCPLTRIHTARIREVCESFITPQISCIFDSTEQSVLTEIRHLRQDGPQGARNLRPP
jgi:hypothetical protein